MSIDPVGASETTSGDRSATSVRYSPAVCESISVLLVLWFIRWYWLLLCLFWCCSGMGCVLSCYAEHPDPICTDIDASVFGQCGFTVESVTTAMKLVQPPVFVCTFSELPDVSMFDGQSGIYGWYNVVDNMLYVGSGEDVLHRGLGHVTNAARSNKALQAAAAMHGWHTFAFIVFGLTLPALAVPIEQAYLDYFHEDLKYNVLKVAGSSRGYRHTEATKQLIAQLRTGKPLPDSAKAKLSEAFTGSGNPFFGKQHPSEFKAQLSADRSGALNPMFGKPKSPEFLAQQSKDKTGAANHMSKQITLVYADTGLLYGTYDTITAAADSIFINRNTITKAMNETRAFKTKTKPVLKLRAYFGPYINPATNPQNQT